VIIVAAGIGLRFGGLERKQYVEIEGKPIIVLTLDRFIQVFPTKNIIVVLNKDHIHTWIKIISKYCYLNKIKIIFGGEQRYHSVKNVLTSINFNDTDLIGVHDAVRPFVSLSTINEAYRTAFQYGTGVPVIDSVNTLRILGENKNNAIDRSTIKQVQNPQVFNAKVLKEAYLQPYQDIFYDDATIVEAAGNDIKLCIGNIENIKITHSQDLIVAKSLMLLYNKELN